MKCNEIKELMGGYMDGELDSQEVEETKQHLKDCSSCGREFSDMKSISASIRQTMPTARRNRLTSKYLVLLIPSTRLNPKNKNVRLVGLESPA